MLRHGSAASIAGSLTILAAACSGEGAASDAAQNAASSGAATPTSADASASSGVGGASTTSGTGGVGGAGGGGVSPSPVKVRAVATALGNTCAAFDDGTVKCWGSNAYGQLGLGDTTDRGAYAIQLGDALPFVALGQGANVDKVALGYSHACALLTNGEVKCWGSGEFGKLGYGDVTNRGDEPGEMGDALPAVDLGAGSKAVEVSVGHFHSCALLEGGAVKCWGRNDFGQLGQGDTNDRGDSPGELGDALATVNLGTDESAVALSVSGSHSCVALASGRVKCWGANHFGQLGLGDTSHRGDNAGELGDALPIVALGGNAKAVGIAAGGAGVGSPLYTAHACALLEGGAIKCWGANHKGQLGLGDTSPRGDGPAEMGDALPVLALGQGVLAASVHTGEHRGCARLTNGAVKCWGWNAYGQLGLGDTLTRGDGPGEMGDALPAVNLGTNALAAHLGAGGEHTCAALADGALKCWGYNDSGQLGTGDTDYRGVSANEMGDALLPVKLFGE